MLCIECGSDAVTFLGAGSKFIAIDHYQCTGCDCDFMIKREGKTRVSSAERSKSDDRTMMHTPKRQLPSGSAS